MMRKFMHRNSFFAVLTVLAAAVSAQAGVVLSIDTGVDTPGLAGFKTHIVTATSDVAGETIAGVDMIGDPADSNPATARGFFGTMNQVMAGGLFPTPFGDFNALLAQPQQDSQFLFATNAPTGPIQSPTGFSLESGTFLRALFSRDTGFGQTVPLAQLVLPAAASATVQYRGVFAVNQAGSIVDLPEISGQLSTGQVDTVNINPIDLGPTTLVNINQLLSATSNGPPVTWDPLSLSPAAGSPLFPATLDAAGNFHWLSFGSARGPVGNGVLYSWNATAHAGTASDTDVAISLRLEIPEPATIALFGLAMVGVVGFFGRKR
jgi:hypothetical protein